MSVTTRNSYNLTFNMRKNNDFKPIPAIVIIPYGMIINGNSIRFNIKKCQTRIYELSVQASELPLPDGRPRGSLFQRFRSLNVRLFSD